MTKKNNYIFGNTQSSSSIEEQESSSILFEYNNKTEQSYINNNLQVPETLDLQEKNFIAAADPTKKEIEKQVTKIVRLKARDHSSKKKERKEYLIYYENWYGVDWQGRKVAPVADHIEGVYEEQETEPIIEKNKIVGKKKSGQHSVYYIPFSKDAVDKIIENSIGSDKETIVFTVKDGSFRNDKYSYEQFVNLSFDDCCRLMNLKGGPRLNPQVLQEELERREKINKQVKDLSKAVPDQYYYNDINNINKKDKENKEK